MAPRDNYINLLKNLMGSSVIIFINDKSYNQRVSLLPAGISDGPIWRRGLNFYDGRYAPCNTGL